MILKTLTNFPTFFHQYAILKESQYWSKEELEEYQLKRLKKLLKHANKNVAYYTKLFEKNNVKINDIQTLEDIQKIPFLTKEIVRNNVNELKAKNYPKTKFQQFYTGGSTGKPLQFYIEKDTWVAELLAYGKIQNEWVGRSIRHKYVNIGGYKIPMGYELLKRTLSLSSFYMNEEYMPIFIKEIKKLKPKHIQSYPSALTTLAVYMKNNDIEPFTGLKTIVSYAETLDEWQRKLLENFFKIRVYDQYGQRETVALGAPCKYSNYFHMFPEFGIIELIGPDGKKVTREGQIGEIVATGFHNDIFPFIRYKTGDLGVFTKEKCKCGRNYPLLKRIEGRTQEFIVSKKNQKLSLTGVYGLIAMSTKNVKNYQLSQKKAGEIIIRIVKQKGFTNKDTTKIIKNFKERFGIDFSFKVKFVDNISLTESGKYRFLIQKLKI